MVKLGPSAGAGPGAFPSWGASAWYSSGATLPKGRRPSPFGGDTVKRVIFVLLMLLLMGCGKLGVGYRVTLAVRNAGDATSKALAAACGEKRVKCKEKHAVKTAGYALCMDKCVKALKAWTQIVKPALNTALRASWSVLEAARLKGEKKAKWQEALRPGACSLIRAVTVDWKILLGKHLKSIMPYLKAAEGLVCK